MYRITYEYAEAMKESDLDKKFQNGDISFETITFSSERDKAEKIAVENDKGDYTEQGFYGTIYCRKIAYIEDAEEWELEDWLMGATWSETMTYYRNDKDLTVPSMAELLGVPQRTLESWLGGQRVPNEFVKSAVMDKLK